MLQLFIGSGRGRLGVTEVASTLGLSKAVVHRKATITDPGQLRRGLATIRERGFAWSREERQPGAASVAAPVFDHEGAPVTVVSVRGPAERFRTQADRHAKLLLEQVRHLSRRMGFR